MLEFYFIALPRRASRAPRCSSCCPCATLPSPLSGGWWRWRRRRRAPIRCRCASVNCYLLCRVHGGTSLLCSSLGYIITVTQRRRDVGTQQHLNHTQHLSLPEIQSKKRFVEQLPDPDGDENVVTWRLTRIYIRFIESRARSGSWSNLPTPTATTMTRWRASGGRSSRRSTRRCSPATWTTTSGEVIWVLVRFSMHSMCFGWNLSAETQLQSLQSIRRCQTFL